MYKCLIVQLVESRVGVLHKMCVHVYMYVCSCICMILCVRVQEKDFL